jgi:hypothetical protein
MTVNVQPIPCPYCGTDCHAEYCDVGVGPPGVQCSPHYCTNCLASEIGPFDNLDDRPLTVKEKECGFYAPHSKLGTSVNQIDNTPIDMECAKALHKIGLLYPCKT